MQFFLEAKKDETTLLRILNGLLGFVVESTEVNIEGSIGLLQVDEHSSGYSQSCLVSSPDSVEWALEAQDIVRELARVLATNVLLELPEDPDHWLLTLKTGEQRAVEVTMSGDSIDVLSRPTV